MNLLLLRPGELGADGRATLSGRRALHAREVLAAAAGDALRVGELGGRVGTAIVERAGDPLVLQVTLTDEPPPRAPWDVLLAVPRPKALKKVLPALASLGVDLVVLLNAARVERSYFGSRVLLPDAVEALLDLGLEQARDTRRPRVLIRDRFRPFVEDELDALFPGADRWVAHPGPRQGAPRTGGRTLLAVGPEGGWVPFELELLEARGFTRWSAGPRALRVEVALPFLLGQLAAGTSEGARGPR